MNRLPLIIFNCLLCFQLAAQSDSSITSIDTTSSTLQVMKDTSTTKKEGFFSFLKEKGFSPKKAAFYSAVFPGGGQIYNRQYWKAPLALGAVGTAGYFVYSNTIEYHRYRDAYRLRVDDDPTTLDEFYDNPNATEANLIEIRDGYQKWMEQSYIAVIVVYSLQVLEAYTSAHLKNFDIDEDLSLQWQPTIKTPQTPTIFNTSTSISTSNMEFGVKMQLVNREYQIIRNF